MMPLVQSKAVWVSSILAPLRLAHLRDRIFGYDLFISYDFEQAGHYAIKLKESLEKEKTPVYCFLDREGFHPGDDAPLRASVAVRVTSPTPFTSLATVSGLRAVTVRVRAVPAPAT